MELSKPELNLDDNLSISVTVTNSGDRIGKESIDLFITDLVGSVSRPNKELKGFDKIELNSGESKKVTFEIATQDLSFIGRDNKRVIESGNFEVTIGNLKGEFKIN